MADHPRVLNRGDRRTDGAGMVRACVLEEVLSWRSGAPPRAMAGLTPSCVAAV